MADDLLQRRLAAAVQNLPLPLQQTMRGVTVRAEDGPTQSIASGSQSGNLAGIIPGQNVINIMDQAAFQKAPEQLAMHEGIHKWQADLPPAIQAQIPPDDPKNPYQVWDTNRVGQLLAHGGTLANMPREQASATGQYYQAQGGDQSAPQAMRDTYGKLIQTMPTVPQSVVMPTDPYQKGINTTLRPPQAPMMMSQKTYAKGQPPDSDPPPPPGYTVDSDPAPPAGYTLDADPNAPPTVKPSIPVPSGLQGPPKESIGSAMQRGAGQGAGDLFGGIKSLPQTVMHPVNTLNAMSEQQSALGDRAVQDFKTGHYGNALWHGVDAAIPVLGPMDAQLTDQYQGGDKAAAMTRGAVNLAPALLDPAMKIGGARAVEAAPSIIDNTVGALKKDFARGKSPGTGFFQARMGPTASMGSLANKAAEANEGIGAQLGSLYDQAQAGGVKVPAKTFFDAINTPADNLRQSLTGPGGTGSTAALDAYTDTFKPVFDKAAQDGGIGPRDIFDTKRNVAKNTSWGDPTMQGMNSMRQQTAGGLSGVLGDVLPETKPLNSAFANTMALADRAKMRADTGSFPLTRTALRATLGAGGATLGAHAAGGLGAAAGALGSAVLDSVPARTSLASGLFYGGKLAENPFVRRGATASLFAIPKDKSSSESKGSAKASNRGQ